MAVVVAAVLVAAIVWGGSLWWGVEADGYGELVLYRPFNAVANVGVDSGHSRLTLAIDDRRWPPPPGALTRYNALLPDHGKLMHMFLVREPALDAFAHVHPTPRTPDTTTFDVALPPLPSGRYRVFGDIVHSSGYAQTMVTTTEVPAPTGSGGPGDDDDSWFAGAGAPESSAAVFTQPDRSTITWERGDPLVAQQDRLLTFVARNADGSPMTLEPYMGMLGHVAAAHEDGSVFAHLHPSGSISMAALQRFGGDVHGMHRQADTARLSIPYAFPKAGRYRLWVQMKRSGQVLTSAFDAVVLASRQ